MSDALVTPRPIASVSRAHPDGIPNLAPFSYFNACAYRPVARLGYMDYTSVETVFEMLRPD